MAFSVGPALVGYGFATLIGLLKLKWRGDTNGAVHRAIIVVISLVFVGVFKYSAKELCPQGCDWNISPNQLARCLPITGVCEAYDMYKTGSEGNIRPGMGTPPAPNTTYQNP